MGNISQSQGAMNQGQNQNQNIQSPHNQYQQNSQTSSEGNFKKNRSAAQTTPPQSSNTINQIPQQQQNVVGTNSGYIPGSNQIIQQQQQPIQANISNSTQSISQSQGGNKISD